MHAESCEGVGCSVALTAMAWRPEGTKKRQLKHGRYTENVVATRRWLREATRMLRELKDRDE